MRMGPDAERLDLFLARVSDHELFVVIRDLGEERFARPVARAIKRDLASIADTAKLADVVANAIPRGAWPPKIHPATRTFQALRMAVNDELGALDAWLASVPALLGKGGRAAAISFHSLEDRAVKRAFEALTRVCRCPPELPVCACGGPTFRAVTRKAVTAGDAELAENPRARSAKLRGVEKL
jgi:16S rRNA (cytosine1402-N4)-methyltransferase